MKVFIKHIVFLLSFVFSLKNLNAQFYFLENATDRIELNFSKKKIETKQNIPFFNVLTIKNPSSQKVEFITNFSYPESWTFIGEKQQRITIEPNDSIFIPFRAAASYNTKGNIGYALVASISDLNGKAIKNEYCFVNIPKEQNIKAKPVSRYKYFDQLSNVSDVELFINNKGNTDELFYIDLELDQSLTTLGAKNNIFHTETTLPSHSDTIISVPIILKDEKQYGSRRKKTHRVKIRTSTADTVLRSAVWLKELDKNYKNEIPDNYKMLSVELGAQNLFSSSGTSYTIGAESNILFKDESSIYSLMQGYGRNFWNEPWKYGRYFLSYKKNSFNLQLGDVSESLGQSTYGRGGKIIYKKNNSHLKVIATKSLFSKTENFGGAYTHTVPFGFIGVGGSYSINKPRKVNSKVGMVNLGTNLKQMGFLRLDFLTSIADWSVNEKKQQVGYGGAINYSNRIQKHRANFSIRYGQPEFYGGYGGRLLATARTYSPLSQNRTFVTDYYNSRYSPVSYIGDSLINDKYQNYESFRATFNSYKNRKLSYFTGLVSEKRESNQFYITDKPTDFRTRNALFNSGIIIRGNNIYNSVNVNFKGGVTFATKYDKEFFDTVNVHKNWVNFQLSAGYRSRIWGANVSYYHGPYTINQQFVHFLNGFYHKSVRVMPHLDIYLYKDRLRYISRLNYNYNITSATNRLSLSNDLIGYLGDTWEFTFVATNNFQSNIDKVTEEKYQYTSSYFEFRVKKDFIIDQPMFQYHDLKVLFFKDLNGNQVKDDDEPGIKDIFFSIKQDEENIKDDEYNTIGHFMTAELLSDFSGEIKYKNIPNGFYTIEYHPVSGIEGAYTTENSVQSIHIGKDETIQIPFTENNKIFGKVKLNRSKLSNLGAIDISNIKVTAEDSKGKKHSSLTDNKGNFIIYVPDVDRYKVSVNNIFFENFELEQNNYVIQLNGYRQFETNFVFNEKRRKINFASSYNYSNLGDKGVEIVRRTNLSGMVKDATTLKPTVAKIKVIDGNGNLVTSTKSNMKTGVFSVSFIAGNNYFIEVEAENYWFYAEKLYTNQVVTFKNLKKDILLKGITVGSLIPMKTLNFKSGEYNIPAISFPELERLMTVLKKNPTVKITVVGHTDDLEIRETTSDLALERAKQVSKYLIANGYNRVKYLGQSNTKPIADNDTENGRRQNRRVEILVTGK